MRKLCFPKTKTPAWTIDTDKFMLTPFKRGASMIKPLVDFIKDIGLQGKVFIGGGYMRYCASNISTTPLPTDIDLYFSDTNALSRMVREIQRNYKHILWTFDPYTQENGLISETKATSPDSICSWSCSPIGASRGPTDHESCTARINNILFGYQEFHPTFYTTLALMPFPLNFIHPDFKKGSNVQEVIDTFDFVICRAGYFSEDEILVDAAFHSNEEKRVLYVRNESNLLYTMIRVIKYSKRGYHIHPNELVRIMNQWKGIDKIPTIIERAERIINNYEEDLEKKAKELVKKEKKDKRKSQRRSSFWSDY